MLNDPPKFYLFEDGNGWHKTDDTLTQKITMDISLGKVVQTAGRCFYPHTTKSTKGVKCSMVSSAECAYRKDFAGTKNKNIGCWFQQMAEHQNKRRKSSTRS